MNNPSPRRVRVTGPLRVPPERVPLWLQVWREVGVPVLIAAIAVMLLLRWMMR